MPPKLATAIIWNPISNIYISVETFGLVSFLREDGWRPSGTPGAGDEYAMPVSDEFCSILESGKMGLSSQRVECNTEINSQPSILLPLAARSHDSYL